MTPGRVLVTNDDGPGAEGLSALVRAAVESFGRDVVVVTPTADLSASGSALGALAGTPVAVRRAGQRWAGVGEAFEAAAYPSTIVTLAMMGAFGPPPDLVLVGVNHGLNIGRGLIHSSTVGAAFTGAVHHVPAAAFSADSPGSGAGVDWAGWHPTLVGLVEALSDRGSADGVLSVNLPARDRDGGDPVWCRVADATAVGRLNVVALPAGGFGCGVTYGPLDELPPADTDAGVVARGRVALTWLPLPYGGAGDPSWPAEFPTRRDVLT